MDYTRVFRIVILAVVIGYSQGKPDITILNNVNNIACGSMTKITCTVTASPFGSMLWYANGVSIKECDESSCYSTGASVPSNYKLSNIGKIFYLEINPVTFDDNSTIYCTDGQVSDSITIFPKTEITNGTLHNETTINGNKVSISVLSNCVEMANGVTFQLTKKKSTEQQFIPDTKHTVTKTINACSNHENPDCGGNMTSKVNITTIVQNESTGDEYSFMLKITYGGSDSWISLGTYTIAKEEHVTTTPSVTTARSNPPQNSSSWCDEDLNQCVTVLVVTGGLCCTVIVAVVIIFTIGNIFIVRFENIPTSTDIANAFQSKGLSITKSECDNNHSRHSSETVSRNCVVSTKNLIKTLPSTIQIGRIKLKLSYVPGRKPFENIYSVTEGSFEQSELNSPQNKAGSRPLPMPSNKNVLPPIGH